jgi:hypothetical protein
MYVYGLRQITFTSLHHKFGSEHNFVAACLFAKLITFLNCQMVKSSDPDLFGEFKHEVQL